MFSKIFSSKLVNSVLAIIGGVVISYLTIKLPFSGYALRIVAKLNCGGLAGLPFSFMSASERLPGYEPNPIWCLQFDYIAFVINALFWFAVIFFGLFLLKKLFKRKLNKNDVEEE